MSEVTREQQVINTIRLVLKAKPEELPANMREFREKLLKFATDLAGKLFAGTPTIGK